MVCGAQHLFVVSWVYMLTCWWGLLLQEGLLGSCLCGWFIHCWASTRDYHKKTMGKRFRMKDLREMSSFLGMQVIHDKNTQQIFLNQSNYFKWILEDFNMGIYYATLTPFTQGLQLEPLPLDSNRQPTSILDHDRYRTLIRSLLYGSMHTQPDISFALGVLSRYLNALGKAH